MEKFPENRSEKRRFILSKDERLCSKKQIEKLFTEGDTFLVYPLKIVYTEIESKGLGPAQVVFAVSTKIFKKAVFRNLVKRRMREAYRLNKQLLQAENNPAPLGIVFIYIGKKILDFHSIEKAMKRSLALLRKNSIPNP